MVESNATQVRAEIGPEKMRKQGFLATFLEYGSVNNSPKPYLNPALDAEEDRYVENMADAVTLAILP
jgi:hypothetical protein